MTLSPAPNQEHWRIGNDDGTVGGHTWISNRDITTRWDLGWPQRVRIQVDQANNVSWAPNLRVHIRIGAQSNGWTSLPVTQASATSTTGSFWVSTGNKKETQGAQTTSSACGSPPTTDPWVNGNPGFSLSSNPIGTVAALKSDYSEWEWNLQCLTSTRAASTFSFRMTDNGTVFTTYTRYATVVTRSTTVAWVAPVATSAKMEPGFYTRSW